MTVGIDGDRRDRCGAEIQGEGEQQRHGSQKGGAGEPLRDDVPLQKGGVVTFLNDASADGSVVFV